MIRRSQTVTEIRRDGTRLSSAECLPRWRARGPTCQSRCFASSACARATSSTLPSLTSASPRSSRRLCARARAATARVPRAELAGDHASACCDDGYSDDVAILAAAVASLGLGARRRRALRRVVRPLARRGPAATGVHERYASCRPPGIVPDDVARERARCDASDARRRRGRALRSALRAAHARTIHVDRLAARLVRRGFAAGESRSRGPRQHSLTAPMTPSDGSQASNTSFRAAQGLLPA